MSLILDALNKADRDRQAAAQPPGINTVHEPLAQTAKRPYLLIAIITLVFIALIAGSVWWFSSGNEQTSEEKTPAPAVAEAPKDDALKKKTRIPGLPKPVQIPKGNANNNPQSKDVDKLYAETATAEAEAKTTNTENKPSDTTTNATPSATPNPVTNTVTNETAALADKPATNSAPSPAKKHETLSDYPEIGRINDLPWSVINKIPTLNYSLHVYVGVKAGNRVLINQQHKSEGQTLSENIKVEKILEDGVILNYQNHQFKLNALNSWVNI